LIDLIAHNQIDGNEGSRGDYGEKRIFIDVHPVLFPSGVGVHNAEEAKFLQRVIVATSLRI
jgi:hypothetical protein